MQEEWPTGQSDLHFFCSNIIKYFNLFMIKPTFSYHIVTGLQSGPIAQLSEYLHCLQGVLESSPGLVMCFFLPETFGGSVKVRDRAASSKGTVSLVYGMVTSRFGNKSI